MPKAIDYVAVLADLQAKKAALDAAIAGIRQIIALGATTAAAGSSAAGAPATVRSDTFYGLSIVEATRKYLALTKEPQSTAKIIAALARGGIPTPAYNTVYSVLRRQWRTVGDVVKLDHTNEWALADWYGSKAVRKRPNGGRQDEPGERRGKADDGHEA